MQLGANRAERQIEPRYASDTFDRALALFAESYANQNERDYRTLTQAVSEGTIKAESGV